MVAAHVTNITLSRRDVLNGFDAASKLYPAIPPLSMWRAWEFAAYRKFQLIEPVLDIGCGDGRFFKMIWPRLKNVTGVDADPRVVASARDSKIYKDVLQVHADRMFFTPATFASAFANCSLEHMDNLDAVLARIAEALRPGAPFLLSVVTERFVQWNSLAELVRSSGYQEIGDQIQDAFGRYHHLANPLPIAEWTAKLERAGFVVRTCIPVIPEFMGRVFLMLDTAWHITKQDGVELGSDMYTRFRAIPDFDKHFRLLLDALFRMDGVSTETIGAVLQTEKR
jgi:SAM-dependent methyltransferase